MRTFESATQEKWNRLPVRQVTDAAKNRSSPAARFESSLTIAALQKEVDEENRIDLVNPYGFSLGPWQAGERAKELLAAMNRKNREFWANGGKPAAGSGSV
jgi:hypothetical protein